MVITNVNEKLAAIEKLGSYEKFEVKQISTGKKYRAAKQSDGTIFVYAPRSKRYGWVCKAETVVNNYDVVAKTADEKGKQWKKRLERAVAALDKSGLWTEIREVYANLLAVDYNDWRELKSYGVWDDTVKVAYDKYGEKYPFMFKTADDGSIQIKSDYIEELSECKLKAMYFGEDNNYYKDEIAKRLAASEKYISPRVRANYDVSFEYSPDKNKAWYSEEYKDCGNGHYYLALDANTAVFYCDD